MKHLKTNNVKINYMYVIPVLFLGTHDFTFILMYKKKLKTDNTKIFQKFTHN